MAASAPTTPTGPRRRDPSGKTSRRPHSDAQVAAVRALIEDTPLTYGEIARKTGVGRASICRWTRDQGWRRHVFAERECGRATAQIRDWGTIQIARMRSRKENLVVVLLDVLLVGKLQLGDDGTGFKFAFVAEIRDVTDDHVVAVETNRISLLDQTFDVVVMTDRFLKH